MYPLTNLVSHFSYEVSKTLIHVMEKGYIVSLVGGSVRDFILKGELGEDLDFELTHQKNYSQDEWKEKLNEFYLLLKELGFEVTKSDRFCVYKIKIGENSLEFASARTEDYLVGSAVKGHSDFQVRFYSQLDPSLSFKRRDFTCNAIALELRVGDDSIFGNIIDPFNGIKAIDNKSLVPCHENFIYDPVRFLRAIRFELKLDFIMSDKLLKYMSQMNLLELTNFYFLSESLKVDIMLFSKRFFVLTKSYSTPVAQRIMSLSYFSNFKDYPVLRTKEEVMDFLILKNTSLEDLENFREFTGIKKSDFRNRVKSACR